MKQTITPRAFVIAIEKYGKGKSLPHLPGTNKDAEVFIDWLVNTKGVKRSNIFCCANESVKARTTGTTASEIIAELARAVKKWADKTDEFYFYFSGHGFSYSTSTFAKSIDVLVASDFTGLETGGRACLNLDEIKTKLWKSLGPEHHYYFIDACRNQIQQDAIDPASTGLGFANSQLGTPTVYKVFSTAQGALSKTKSGFTPLLVKGLSGSGRAKGLRTNSMYVIFDLLGAYLKKQLQAGGQEVDFSREGNGEGFLLELKPIPKTKCEVKVAKAKPGDKFVLTVSDIKGLSKRHKFTGPSFQFDLFPDDYSFQLKHSSGKVLRKPPPEDPVDLYDPCVLNFELKVSPGGGASKAKAKAASDDGFESVGGASPASIVPATALTPPDTPPPPITGTLHVKGVRTEHTQIEVLSLRTGELLKSNQDLKQEVPPGEYLVKLRERSITVSKHEVTVRAGKTKTINLLVQPKDKVRDSILKCVKAINVEGASVFSESHLGPLANQDLGLWLTLFGASRILGQPGQFRKLERLALQTFDDIKKNEAVVYVLAGFEKSTGRFGVGLSSGPVVDWKVLKRVKGLQNIYELRLPATVGSHLLSFKIPKRSPITCAIHCLPNRATLATLAQDKEGQLTFHQSILPIRHLTKYMDPTVRSYLHGNMLGLVRTMTLAQSQFARKRSVQEQIKKTDPGVWSDLVHHKWLDPVMALIAAYDVIRHGTIGQAKGLLKIVNSNLRKYFEGMGDIEAIAKLLGTKWSLPTSPPLFLDGVLAFDEIQENKMLPLSPDRLNYSSPWTVWQRAVNDFEISAPTKIKRRRSTRKAGKQVKKTKGGK